MALSKSVPSAFGIPATYHNIEEIRWDKSSQSTAIKLNSFKDKQARLDNLRPLQNDYAVLAEQTSVPSLSEAYSLVKGLEAWSGAKDA